MNAPLITKSLAPVALEFKFSTERPGSFTGYASVFNVKDEGEDIVLPGAFKASLAARPAQKVKMLWHHQPDEPIGAWTEMVEDDKGLRVAGELLLTVEKGSEAYELAKIGQVDGLSIGFRSIDWQYDAASDTRILKKVDLFEVSLCTFPMNPMATIDGIKSADVDAINSLSEAERFLREAASFDRKSATAFVSRIKRLSQREAAGEAKEAALLERLSRLNSR